MVERGEIGIDEICVRDSHMPKPEFALRASYVFLGRAGYCGKELIGDWQERFSKPSIRGDWAKAEEGLSNTLASHFRSNFASDLVEPLSNHLDGFNSIG